MVRKGSSVRVRQRALGKPPHGAAFSFRGADGDRARRCPSDTFRTREGALGGERRRRIPRSGSRVDPRRSPLKREPQKYANASFAGLSRLGPREPPAFVAGNSGVCSLYDANPDAESGKPDAVRAISAYPLIRSSSTAGSLDRNRRFGDVTRRSSHRPGCRRGDHDPRPPFRSSPRRSPSIPLGPAELAMSPLLLRAGGGASANRRRREHPLDSHAHHLVGRPGAPGASAEPRRGGARRWSWLLTTRSWTSCGR
jgi:hypothetical protein